MSLKSVLIKLKARLFDSYVDNLKKKAPSADFMLTIRDLDIAVPVYVRKSGVGQDIVDAKDSAVMFHLGSILVLADHCYQSNFANLRNAVVGKTWFELSDKNSTRRFLCTENGIGHIKTENGHDHLYDWNWEQVYKNHSGALIYTCRQKSAPDVMDVTLTFWKEDKVV